MAGNLVGFELLPGQRHDPVGVARLIAGHDFGARTDSLDLIGDKAFAADWISEELQRREAEMVISQHPKRTAPRENDHQVYKQRQRIENYFGKLKEFKRIAMGACKTDSSFAAIIHAGAAVIRSR